MKFLTLAMICVLAVSAAALVIEDVGLRVAFREFQEKYNKHYSGPEEEARRFEAFKASIARAAKRQELNPEATYGVNVYSDLTPAEFKAYHSLNRRNTGNRDKGTAVALASTTPQEWDWRTKGAVTYVKNQGQCGSCWAFSTTGAIESSWFLAGHNLTAVSEQEIVSCDTTDEGCNGGDPGTAMDWLVKKEDGWITTETDYPYTSGGGQTGKCDLPKPKAVQIYSHYNVASNEATMADYLYANGPLSICVDASSWQDYTSGILKNCGDQVDHCVLLVGFNLANKPPYWIVKNSWGKSWGIEGYLYIEYGKNECDLTSEPRKALVHQNGPTPSPTPAPPPTPSPPTTPAPPAPNGTFTQYWCDTDKDCKDLSKCKKNVFPQDKCLVNPEKKSVKAICQKDKDRLHVEIFNDKDCAGSSYFQNQDLDSCIQADGGKFIYNECP